MIPVFPAFGPIPLDGAKAFAALTKSIAYNSDFSHASVWAWAIVRRIRCSTLNGNLVLRYENGLTGQFEYTFAGVHEPERTAEILLGSARAQGWPEQLGAVPEETARRIMPTFVVEEDRDYFDYLYDLNALASMRGNEYRAPRRLVNQFTKRFNATIERLDFSDGATIRDIIALSERWRENKRIEGKIVVPSVWGIDDISPMLRLLDCAAHFRLLGIGVRVEGTLVAYFIAEIRTDCAFSHFAKADTLHFKGATIVAMRSFAQALLTEGCTILNFQEDMGSPSLRQAKLGMRPSGFVKKYTVRPATTADILYVAETPNTGRGLFTRRPFARGELVFTMSGECRRYESRTAEDAHRFENWLGIGKDFYVDPAPPYIYANHSCEPNLGVREQFEFIALRDIAIGEELTYDYSITTDELPWTMRCKCGHATCRGMIRSIQFLPPEIYKRYLPYVGPYFRDVYAEARQAENASSTRDDKCTRVQS